MKSFIQFLRTILIFLIVIVLVQMNLQSQTGSFSRYVSQDGWSGNVEFYVPSGSGAKPLVIGLHPAQSPAYGIRDMLKQSAEDKKCIVVCPDGADATLSQSIIPLITYCKSQFSIDEKKIILTGYSAGGYTTFSFGPANYQYFKGLIGIAAFGYDVPQAAMNSLGFAMICGTSDQAITSCRGFKTMLESSGAAVKLVEVPGVGHTGQYFFSSQFTTDWNSCYDFVMNFIPKPSKIILSTPSNGQTDVEIPTVLTWQADANATSYQVELSDSKGLVESKTVTVNTITFKNLKPGTEYSWMVVGKNSGGEGQWSNEWRFTTKPLAPTAQVSLKEPTNGAKNLPKTIDFKWSVIAGATFYKIQILNEADSVIREYANVEPDAGSNEVIKTIRNLDLGLSYKWQVRGFNSGGDGPWSEQWEFSTAPAPPGMITLLEPEHNSTDMTTLPLFKWNLLTEAERYHFQLLEYNNDVVVVDDTNIVIVGGNTGVYQVKDELKGLTKYKWHVAGINTGGQGPWSEFRIFTTWDPSSVDDTQINEARTYPNPINNIVYFEIYMKNTSNVCVKIYDLLGVELRSDNFRVMEPGWILLNTDYSELGNGMYFYQVSYDGRIQTGKLIIHR
jgi:predicted esterase